MGTWVKSHNNTRKAISEFDKLCRGIYTLKCALNPKILSDAHLSQNGEQKSLIGTH